MSDDRICDDDWLAEAIEAYAEEAQNTEDEEELDAMVLEHTLAVQPPPPPVARLSPARRIVFQEEDAGLFESLYADAMEQLAD